MLSLRPLIYGLGISTAALGLVSVWLGGLWLVAVPAYVFGLVPVLDAVIGLDHDDVESEAAARAWRDWRYDVWLWLWAPLHLLVTVLGCMRASTINIHHEHALETFIGLALTSGTVGGLGINVAHELMHRKGRIERALAELLMTSVTYTHFCVEHVLGHHFYVATHRDPASARRGEGLYRFLPRTIIGGLLSAWRIEKSRAAKLNVVGSLQDRRVRYPLVLAMTYVGIFMALGPMAVALFVAQSVVAIVLLETINYVEHYGLTRREIEPGRYERCTPAHSWNSAHRLTNRLLFNLPRHADHHHVASRPFFALRDIDESPQLPTGYAAMLLCAFIPPLYRSVMDPRVTAWNARAAPVAPEAQPSRDAAPPTAP